MFAVGLQSVKTAKNVNTDALYANVVVVGNCGRRVVQVDFCTGSMHKSAKVGNSAGMFGVTKWGRISRRV